MGGRKSGSRGRVARSALLLALCASLLAVASSAGAPSPSGQARLDSTVRFLQGAQNLDGGFGGSPGAKSGQLFTAWVALALAAAGINPRDKVLPGGTDAYTYLLTHYRQGIAESDCAPVACTTTFERELMVVNASGASPRDFGGVDLVEELLDRARPDGSFPHVPGGQPGVNDTIFAIFALAPVDEPVAQAPIQRAADWAESAQQEVGGWAWQAGKAPHEVDMTGAAIQGLVAAGRSGNASVKRGLAYLRDAQNPDGGFPMFPGEPESNAASTCWATQAIWAAGENPEAWLTGSGRATEEPLDYLESLQAPDGHIRWKASDDLNGVWMTAYCAPAFAGQAWPIPAAPRSNHPVQPPGPGQGEGTQSGDGVIAGGGAGSAPLFSRPRPQSKGKTPGGARVVRNGDVKVRDRSGTRRGANTAQPTRTQTAEATAAPVGPGASEAATSVQGRGSGAGGGPSGARRSPPAGRGPGASSGGAGSGGGGSSPRVHVLSAGASGAGGDRRVTGILVGSAGSPQGDLHFGAPGLHGAGVDGGDEGAAAITIGAAALLVALGGVGWERRHEGAMP